MQTQSVTMAMPATPAAARAIDRTSSLVALLLVGTVTEAMFLILPSFVGALDDVLHLSAAQTGLLASADLTGIALTTATAPWWLRRVSWRPTVLASLAAFLAINLVCFAVPSAARGPERRRRLPHRARRRP
jgi:MFS family permease